MENRNFTTARAGVSYDAGLRAHMNRVYSRMTGGVLVTALTAAVVSSSPDLMKFFLGGPQAWLVIFAPLLVVWFGFNPARMAARQLAVSFFLISVLYGISFSVLGVMFTHESIARAFFVAAGAFAGLSIFGYATRKNLDGLGTFCVMGMWGLCALWIVHIIFSGSFGYLPVSTYAGPSNVGPHLSLYAHKQNEIFINVICVIGVIVFSGITAWQTQATKEMYNASYPEELASRMAWMAALNLYIAFIALFQYILQFMGDRR